MITFFKFFFNLFILFYFILFNISCSSTQNKRNISKELSKTINASYIKVWQASLKELSRFKLKKVDFDNGIIITEDIETYEFLNNKNIKSTIKSYFYLSINELSKYPYKTKISVSKFSKLNNSNRIIGTDYIDEQIILYRVKRNLELERKKLEYR
jgi:hypothetical protein